MTDIGRVNVGGPRTVGGLVGQEMGVSRTIHFDIFTLFPDMFGGPFAESIIKRAQEKELASISLHNIRSYTTDRHSVCDDTPYGGGGGMLMKPEPIFRAVETVLTHPVGWSLQPDEPLPEWSIDRNSEGTLGSSSEPNPETSLQEYAKRESDRPPIILMTPQGRPFTQHLAQELAQHPRLVLLCGRYEGVDERVRSQLVTDEISIGDYVLSGGELASMIVVDALVRLIPGVLGYELSAHKDSHSPGRDGLLEGPQYTRPPLFRGESIPDVLLSGHHANIDKWHREQSLLRTLERRPELLSNAPLSDDDLHFLQQNGWVRDKLT